MISIIGILLALLIPGLSLAREAANDLICKTNLEHIFKGAFYYAEIEDTRRLPNFGPLEVRAPEYSRDWWPTQVSNGMEVFEPEVFRCPSDRKPFMRIHVIKDGNNIRMATGGPVLPLSYRGTCDTLEWIIARKEYQPKRITDWLHPDRAIMLVEGWPNPNLKRECFRLSHMQIITFLPDNLPTWERHTGGTNLLHMDGHIDRYTPLEAETLAYNQEHSFFTNIR